MRGMPRKTVYRDSTLAEVYLQVSTQEVIVDAFRHHE